MPAARAENGFQQAHAAETARTRSGEQSVPSPGPRPREPRRQRSCGCACLLPRARERSQLKCAPRALERLCAQKTRERHEVRPRGHAQREVLGHHEARTRPRGARWRGEPAPRRQHAGSARRKWITTGPRGGNGSHAQRGAVGALTWTWAEVTEAAAQLWVRVPAPQGCRRPQTAIDSELRFPKRTKILKSRANCNSKMATPLLQTFPKGTQLTHTREDMADL